MSLVRKAQIGLICQRFLNFKNPRNIYWGIKTRKWVDMRSILYRNYGGKSLPTHRIIGMPALSPTMSSGTIGEWKKKAGESISPGEILVEIETDKAQVDFEFQEEGYIAKILLESGTKDVEIGAPIAILVEEESDIEAFSNFTVNDVKKEGKAVSKEKEDLKEEKQSTESPRKVEEVTLLREEKPSDRIFASPIARLLAAEKGIPLEKIKGTGPKGRIIKFDVDNFEFEPVSAVQPAAIQPAVTQQGLYTDIPLTNIRKTIASRLAESTRNTPHFYVTVSIVMDKVVKLREALNNTANGQYKISINDIIVKASAVALQKVPELNSGWFGDFIRQYHSVDISIAVATPTGLITPIVKDVQNKGLLKINNEIKELGNKAREGKLKPEEYQGGTFTISNMGMYGIEQFTSIINPPQSSILAVGSIENFLVEDPTSEKQFKTEKRVKVTLSSDHRVVDGAVAAKWATTFKSILENPLDLLL